LVPGELTVEEPVRPSQAVEVKIKLLPRRANDNLGNFFSASDAHVRVYEFFRAMVRHHSVRTASAMAFDLFLALIPMLALSAWTISRVLHDRPDALLEGSLIMDLTPSELRGFLSQNLRAFSAKQLAPAALLVCWWLASSAFYTMISLFEEAFDCEPRSWLKGRLLSLAFALVGLTLFVSATGAGVLLTLDQLSILRLLLRKSSEVGLLHVTLLLAGWLILAAYLALIYRFSIRRPSFRRRVWPGALAASTLGIAASVSLGYYVANIARYSLFYGSLAAIVVVMFWLWLWCSAILLGAELNITLEDVRVIRASGDGAADNGNQTAPPSARWDSKG
jgi:membrane protein